MLVIMQGSAFLPTPSKGAGAIEYLTAKLATALADEGHYVALLCLEGSQVVHEQVHLMPIPAKGSAVAREGLMAKAISEILAKAGKSKDIGIDEKDVVLFDHSLHQLAQRRCPDLPAVTMSHGMAPLSPWARNPVFTSEHHGHLHGVKDPVAVHNGIDVQEVPFYDGCRENHLVWAGRIMRYKRPHIAAEVARSSGKKLLLAGPIVEADYARRLETDENVLLLGEVAHDALLDVISKAQALLFTSDETEPAGIVLLEAQAAGTPVIAFRHGANAEFTDRSTARLVKNQAEMVSCVLDRPWEEIDSAGCRRWVAENRSIEAMAAAAAARLVLALEGSS